MIENQFPDESTPPHGAVVRPSALLKVRGAQWFDYVVLEDGTLVLGQRSGTQGHANLAQLQAIKAAGQVQVSGGGIIQIDNASGHYPHDGGPTFAAEALDAFRANGFHVPDRVYVPKHWNPQTNQWEPIDATPN